MRRRFVGHPRGNACDGPIRLRNGDQINSPAGELPENRHGLTALGMEPIVYLPLAMRLTSSMWLF